MYSVGGIEIDPEKIAREEAEEIFKFAVRFENYLEGLGGPEEWLQLVTKPLWRLKNGVAYMYAEKFVSGYGLEEHSKLPGFPQQVKGHHLIEALAFLLKNSWDRGYWVYKFRVYDCIPVANYTADPEAILDRITALGPGNMGTHIKVFFHRVVSFSTEEETIRRHLSMYGDSVIALIESYLDEWADCLRGVFGWGVLCSEIELAMAVEAGYISLPPNWWPKALTGTDAPSGSGQHIWDAFISHASEDKQSVALPLAKALKRAGLRVWLDAFEIKLGDSLRRKIDEGLAGSRYGVVILSSAFFAKEWTKKELDALVSREDGREKVILPVWHNITDKDIACFSPILASKIGVSTKDGISKVVKEIRNAIG